jgi:hypothetical protein
MARGWVPSAAAIRARDIWEDDESRVVCARLDWPQAA